jgi:transketolase
MRKALVKTLVELAEKDPRVLLLTADLGYTVLEPFVDRFPDRFFNVGVAEQNMIGLATGLADGGFIPYVYSIATFAALRPYEFIRNGPVLQRLPVRIIGVGGGFEYDHAGPTHYALEDVGALRMQPGLQVVTPADFEQCRSALLSVHESAGPAYFRLGKDETYAVPGLAGRFEPGRAHIVRQGKDALFIGMGPAVAIALRAADILSAQGVESTVMAVSSMSPAPIEDLRAALAGFPHAITVEAHYTTGGVGSLVCEVVAEHNLDCRVTRCGVTRNPSGEQGSQEFMNRLHGFSPEHLVSAALENPGRSRASVRPGRAVSDWAAVSTPAESVSSAPAPSAPAPSASAAPPAVSVPASRPGVPPGNP